MGFAKPDRYDFDQSFHIAYDYAATKAESRVKSKQKHPDK
jgi:hypothetical protein